MAKKIFAALKSVLLDYNTTSPLCDDVIKIIFSYYLPPSLPYTFLDEEDRELIEKYYKLYHDDNDPKDKDKWKEKAIRKKSMCMETYEFIPFSTSFLDLPNQKDIVKNITRQILTDKHCNYHSYQIEEIYYYGKSRESVTSISNSAAEIKFYIGLATSTSTSISASTSSTSTSTLTSTSSASIRACDSDDSSKNKINDIHYILITIRTESEKNIKSIRIYFADSLEDICLYVVPAMIDNPEFYSFSSLSSLFSLSSLSPLSTPSTIQDIKDNDKFNYPFIDSNDYGFQCISMEQFKNEYGEILYDIVESFERDKSELKPFIAEFKRCYGKFRLYRKHTTFTNYEECYIFRLIDGSWVKCKQHYYWDDVKYSSLYHLFYPLEIGDYNSFIYFQYKALRTGKFDLYNEC